MEFTEALETLESPNCRGQDKLKAYQSIHGHFCSETTNVDENLSVYSQRLLKVLCQDVASADKSVHVCLDILEHCLSASFFRGSQIDDSRHLIQAIIKCARKSQSMTILRKVFHCLATQHFISSVLATEVVSLIEMTESSVTKAKSQSCSLLEETVDMFVRLEEQVSDCLKTLPKGWSRLILPGLVSSSDSVREKTFNVLIKFRKELQCSPDLSKHLIKAINMGLAQSLKCLMAKHEIYALKVWALVVDICGKEFHKGPSINAMLEIIEIGFKSSPEAVCQAFHSWRSLINNFGLDKNVIADPKRVKLLMMVFRYHNAKTEAVAIEKLRTWWHFAVTIGQKLAANFEKIVYPMLQFCVGNGRGLLQQPSRIALKTATTNLQASFMSTQNRSGDQPSFGSVQKLGLEAVAHFLRKEGRGDKALEQKVTWSLENLPHDTFEGSASFTKHAPVLINAVCQISRELKKELDEPLVIYAWTCLSDQLRIALDSSNRTELRDIFSNFLTNLQSMVEDNVFSGDTLFKLAAVSSRFPPKVLSSTAFNVSRTVRGSPALFLCELLLSPTLMEAASEKDSFADLFSSLVSSGVTNVQGALVFLQTVTELVDSNSDLLTNHEMFWKMWNSIGTSLQKTVTSSNEVNQGDALEYNFDCMCAVLLLPIKYQLADKISTATSKSMTKCWKELYHSFARLSALVANAESNVCLEEICSKILQKGLQMEPLNLDFLASLCHKMVDCVDFSAFHNNSSVTILTLSPSKWTRRRQRPLGNLHSFVHLLQKISTRLTSKIFHGGVGEKLQDGNDGALISTAHLLVEVCSSLFGQLSSPAMISSAVSVLSMPLAALFKGGSDCSLQRLFVPSFWTKVEKLWNEISFCIIRYTEPYNSELLSALSPLFEATFLHPRRAIKNQALSLWNTTFSKAQTLEYPSDLKPILIKIKEKATLVLPGWIDPDEAVLVIGESPFSEMSLGGDSQAVEPPALPRVLSPHRPKASMLNKDLSPVKSTTHSSPIGKNVSPAKVMTPKEVRKLFSPSTGQQNVVDLMPEKEFVVISPSAVKKKCLLTEHQKEVLKEKSVLPVMYNNLDASQDISLMSQFGTETQNESCMAQDVSNPSDKVESMEVPAMQPPKLPDKALLTRSSRRLSRLLSKDVTTSSDANYEAQNTDTGVQNTTSMSPTTANSNTKKHDQEQCDSPFVMFRQKQIPSPPTSLGQNESPKSNSAEKVISGQKQSENLTSSEEKQPRRVSLRKLDSPVKPIKQSKKTDNLLDVWLKKYKEDELPSSNVAESCTLVEDTQSPEKLKSHSAKQTDSVVETPTKSDDSLSHHLKVSSARKLFIDDVAFSKGTENLANKPTSESIEESVSSSQGFEPNGEAEKAKTLDHQTMFGFSQLLDEVDDNLAAEETGNMEDSIVPSKESENLVSATEESESFTHITMPTLASLSKEMLSLPNSKSSSSNNSSTQPTSSDTTPPNSSSNDEDFFPVQSTLQNDSHKQCARKRKNSSPKKYLPGNIKRRSRHKQEKQIMNLEAHKTPVNGSEGKPEDFTPSANHSFASMKEKLTQDNISRADILGEVTPDTKSPTNSTPQRGHSSSKRKRRMTAEGNVEVKAKKCISPSADEEGASKGLPLTKTGRKSPIKVVGQKAKRRLRSTHRNKSPKSKHMLRTRSKSLDSSSPPRKLRKLQQSHENVDSSYLPQLSEEKIDSSVDEKETNADKSDDDMPLAKLKHQAANKEKASVIIEESISPEEIVACQPLILPEKKEASEDLNQKAVSCESAEPQLNTDNVQQRVSPLLLNDEVDKALSTILPKISEEVNNSKIAARHSLFSRSNSSSALQQNPIPDFIIIEDSEDHFPTEEPTSNDPKFSAAQSQKSKSGVCGHVESQTDILAENQESENDITSNSEVSHDKESVIAESSDALAMDDHASHMPEVTESVDNLTAIENNGNPTLVSSLEVLEKQPIRNADQNKEMDTDQMNGEPSTKMQVSDVCSEVANDENQQLSKYEEEADGGEKLQISRKEPNIILHDWSPSRSPSFSILKKKTGSSSPATNRVSFAEPVVNGESPVREKYHCESLPTSPLISRPSSQRKGTPYEKSIGKVSGYRKQGSRKETRLSLSGRDSNLPVSPLKSQPASQYKATQESQLDSINPIFPDLVDCDKPVGELLPQLTSTFWYRGLQNLMKGRNLHTIGDLASLSEVQINQLPIRHPRLETVRTTLKAYMVQHGLFKPLLNLPVLEAHSPDSRGATIGHAITPSSIADKGIDPVRNDSVLDRLSPIEAPAESASERQKGSCDELLETTSSTRGEPREMSHSILSTLSRLVELSCGHGTNEVGNLRHLTLNELFDCHQKLNQLFGNVVDEMRARQTQNL